MKPRRARSRHGKKELTFGGIVFLACTLVAAHFACFYKLSTEGDRIYLNHRFQPVSTSSMLACLVILDLVLVGALVLRILKPRSGPKR